MACCLFAAKLLPEPMASTISWTLGQKLKEVQSKCENFLSRKFIWTLQWRHNERDGVSNNRRLHCLFNCGWGADQRKHQSSASPAFVRGIHRWSVNSPHKRPVTRKMFPFDDVIMEIVFWYIPLNFPELGSFLTPLSCFWLDNFSIHSVYHGLPHDILLVNSLVPERCGYDLKNAIVVKDKYNERLGECHKTSLVIGQYWFR